MAVVRKARTLETRIGYRFKDRTLLDRALTHSSARTVKTATSDNERLEFLGDRVLGLAVAEQLNDAFPDASEGELERSLRLLQSLDPSGWDFQASSTLL